MVEQLFCEKCKKQLLASERIYSCIYQGYLCEACYHNQFQEPPSQLKPLFFKDCHKKMREKIL